MNTLTIDIGNSRTKYDFWADNGFICRHDIDSIEELPGYVESEGIEGIIVSSVRERPESLLNLLKEKTKCKVVYFDNYEIKKYGDRIKYNGNIGTDRIAAFLGAQALFEGTPMLIVDMGTAMTLDVADSNGNYNGGNISPGFQSRMKTLAEKTHLLPEVEKTSEYISFGNDTVSSIRSGAINGVIGEIKFAAYRAEKEFDVKKTIITGGDGEWFAGFLGESIDCLIDPYLVGRGLNYHLRKYYF